MRDYCTYGDEIRTLSRWLNFLEDRVKTLEEKAPEPSNVSELSDVWDIISHKVSTWLTLRRPMGTYDLRGFTQTLGNTEITVSFKRLR
jgi:hypothetical protein